MLSARWRLLAHSVALIPGISHVAVELGELVVHTDVASMIYVLTTLRDHEDFAFEQMMDLCGVDWPERPLRFDVVYNLLSVALNHRIRVIVQTDAVTPVPSVHEPSGPAPPGGSGRRGICSAFSSAASPICAAS